MTLFPRSGMGPLLSCRRWGSPSSLRTASRTCLGSVSPFPLSGPLWPLEVIVSQRPPHAAVSGEL